MVGDQESIVKDLIERVHQLMNKHRTLSNQYLELSRENEDLQRQVNEQETKIDTIGLQYKTAKIATNVLAPGEDKEEARQQINRIVREIDECIALLNM